MISTQVDTAFAALDVSHTGKITASDVMACAAGLGVKVDAEEVMAKAGNDMSGAEGEPEDKANAEKTMAPWP